MSVEEKGPSLAEGAAEEAAARLERLAGRFLDEMELLERRLNALEVANREWSLHCEVAAAQLALLFDPESAEGDVPLPSWIVGDGEGRGDPLSLVIMRVRGWMQREKERSRSLIEDLRRRVESTEGALREAEGYVRQYERRIAELETRLGETSAALGEAQQFVRLRARELDQSRERLEEISGAHAEAQRLAWERLDRIGELERALGESREHAASCERELTLLTERTEKLKRHPLWWLIQRIMGITL